MPSAAVARLLRCVAPSSTGARAEGPPPAAAPPQGEADALHHVLDALGALVHLVGAAAVDTEARTADQARHLADRWRRHLTLGLAHPRVEDGPEPDAADARRGTGLAARDWTGAVRWAIGERQAERAHVLRTTDELRDTVWTLVRGLHGVVGAEQEAGQATRAALGQVEQAIRGERDPERLREAALRAVGDLATTLADRERQRERRVAALGAELATLGAALEEARRDSASDALTGLGNRRAFDAAVAHAVALYGLWRQPVCLLMADVDGLKQLNDRLGHLAGDAALRRVAGQISRTFLRRSDVLARVGGDEFAMVLRDVTADEGARVAWRLVEAVRVASETAAADGPEHALVGLSVGVAALLPGDEPEAWVARADAALYAAKRGGRGRVATAEATEATDVA